MPSAARFAFSSPVGGQTPVPDATFFVSQGYQYVRKIEPAAWVNRSSTLSWRGTANGEGRLTFDAADSADPTVIPRLRLIMKLREQPDCDARLVRIEYKGADWTGVPLAGNFVGPPIPTEHWSSCKYAIDIDGETNAWSNLFVRLLMGCCVIKVESQHGYRQWYYDRLKPFENYVPVKPDMSDLLEKIDWARSHEAEARTIAAAGRELALSLDFKSVRQDAIDIIAANWKRG
ncbi:MAG: glycosyl transferase family 90 [Devosia sp.]